LLQPCIEWQLYAADEDHATTGAEGGGEEVVAVAGTLWEVEIHVFGRVTISGTMWVYPEIACSIWNHGKCSIAVPRGLDGWSLEVARNEVLGRDREEVVV